VFKNKNARLRRFPEYRGKAAKTVYPDRHLNQKVGFNRGNVRNSRVDTIK